MSPKHVSFTLRCLLNMFTVKDVLGSGKFQHSAEFYVFEQECCNIIDSKFSDIFVKERRTSREIRNF